MPTIINLFMSYRCAKHESIELTVVQPTNSHCRVQPCPLCAAEREGLFIEMQDKIHELKARINELNKIDGIPYKPKKKGGKRK